MVMGEENIIKHLKYKPQPIRYLSILTVQFDTRIVQCHIGWTTCKWIAIFFGWCHCYSVVLLYEMSSGRPLSVFRYCNVL